MTPITIANKKVIIWIIAGIVTLLPLIDNAIFSDLLVWPRVPVRAMSSQTPHIIDTKNAIHAHIMKLLLPNAAFGRNQKQNIIGQQNGDLSH